MWNSSIVNTARHFDSFLMTLTLALWRNNETISFFKKGDVLATKKKRNVENIAYATKPAKQFQNCCHGRFCIKYVREVLR